MKELFDRHAERLTATERRAIGQTIAGSRAAESRSRQRWAFSAAAVALAAGAITLTLVHREPIAPRRIEPTRSSGGTSNPERQGARVPPTRPGDRRGGALAVRESTPQVAIVPRAAKLPDVSIVPEPAAIPRGPRHSRPFPPTSHGTPGGTGAVTGVITDSQRRPVPYAHVIVLGTKWGAQTGDDGTYRIDRLPPATYSLQVQALGYARQLREGVQVAENRTASADVRLEDQAVTMEEISVTAEKRIDVKSSAPKQTISADQLRSLPVDNLREAVGVKAGVVTQGGELHARGGRSGEIQYQFDGIQVVPPAPAPAPPATASPAPAPSPVIPTTGGTSLPNDEVYDSMFFKTYGVNPFVATDEDSLSTFAVDVDAASYTVTRRYIELGHLPPAEAVRVEEFVNFFPQGYPHFESDDFRILVDGAPSPFGLGYHLVRIGLKGREIAPRARKPATLTFIIDVSGSMDRENRLGLVKRALRLLVDQMRDDDRIGIVVYGTTGRVLLEPIALGETVTLASRRPSDEPSGDEPRRRRSGRERILEAIDLLSAEGSTNAEQGLQLGYEMARRGYRQDVINRIVLCSDGVANVGRTGAESILDRTRTEADRGIHLNTIGFGMGNYNDVLMEQLANKGDGNYYYVDDLDEARRVFVENLTGTLQTIARDAKVQVEFDPSRVLRYRLLGFENRDVADRDFRNDKVDAGDIGAGHEVTALYEVKLAPRSAAGRIATVKLRYQRPEHDGNGAREAREIATDIRLSALSRRFEDAVAQFRLDAAVAEFAEILRGSYWAKEGRLSDVLSVARSAARGLQEDAANEFVSLVEKAARLSEPPKPEEPNEER